MSPWLAFFLGIVVGFIAAVALMVWEMFGDEL